MGDLDNVLQQALDRLNYKDNIQLGVNAPVVNLDESGDPRPAVMSRPKRKTTQPDSYKDFHSTGKTKQEKQRGNK